MNKLLKFAIGATIVAPFLMAGVAAAATIPATTVFDGQSDVWGTAGQSVQATFRVNIPAGEVVHAIRTKVDAQATVCTPIGPFEGAQNVDVNVNITLPPNTNNVGYSFVADLYRTTTMAQAEALTGNLACTGTVDTAAYNGGTVVNVVPLSGPNNTANSPAPSSWEASIAALTAQLTALQGLFAQLTTVVASLGPKPICAGLTQYNYLSQGMSGAAGLQSFLIANGQSIPAGATGYFGNQTAGALNGFKSANHC